jgi:predicted nucleic acid-binding Zn ribbon protein
MAEPGRPQRPRQPRQLGDSLARVIARTAPQTLLAEIQAAWPEACGEAIAAASEPVAERQGTVTIACSSGAWAQELEFMQDDLLTRLEAVVGEGRIGGLRFTADLSRHR